MTGEGQDRSDGTIGAASGDARHARLHAAILHEVAHGGFTDAKIGQIAKRARVSTKTFYALYGTKEECFLAALRETRPLIEVQTADAIANTSPENAATVALSALVALAVSQTDAFYALTHEALFTSAPAVAERERLFTGLASQIEGAVATASARAQAPDIPALVLISGAIRLLGIAKRRGDLRPELSDSLSDWASSYTAPLGSHRWRGFTPETALLPPAEAVAAPSTARLPNRGRPRRITDDVRLAQREQILVATAEVLYSNGYANTTVADIVAASQLSREVFYANFHSKQDAFTALIKQIFEQVIGACAGAFFASERPWPERAWDAGEAMSRMLAANPRLAYAAFAESGYVVSPPAMDADEMLLAMTVFLEDGYSYRPEAADKPRIVGDAIAGAILEMINQIIRHQRVTELPGWLPLIAYMMLAPFTGVSEACDLVDGMLANYRK